jgi:60 kDa SS-A/Ro ribonucleoprotein
MDETNWKRLERFLVLGCETSVYRAGAAGSSLTEAASLTGALWEDGTRVVSMIEGVVRADRAPRSEPALFALAMAASPRHAPATVNSAALAAMPAVVRQASELCSFVAFARTRRGWGRGLRAAIARWYLERAVGELACEILRTPERHGWAHRDLLRMSHPKPKNALQNALFQWAVEGGLGHLAPPDIANTELRPLYAYERARAAADEYEVAQLIDYYHMTDETVPAEWKRSAVVWEALLEHMPYAAVLRNLEVMAAAGLFGAESPVTALAVARLMDRRRIQESRIHPVAIAMKRLAYRARADASPIIVDALETAERIAMSQLAAGAEEVHIVEGQGGSELSRILAAQFRRMFREAGPEARSWILLNATNPPDGKRSVMILEDGVLEPPSGSLLVHGIDASVPAVVADFLGTA